MNASSVTSGRLALLGLLLCSFIVVSSVWSTPTNGTGALLKSSANSKADVLTATPTRSKAGSCDEVVLRAKREPGYGYSIRMDRRHVRLGVVGKLTNPFREYLKETRTCRVRLVPALNTRRQLKSAEQKVFAADLEGGLYVERLPRARGLLVYTSDQRLIDSHNPTRVLGVRVGVLIRNATVTATSLRSPAG